MLVLRWEDGWTAIKTCLNEVKNCLYWKRKTVALRLKNSRIAVEKKKLDWDWKMIAFKVKWLDWG